MPDGTHATSEVTMGEVQRTLARMDARMERVVDDHETRLRRVEKWMYVLPPTVIVAGASVIIAVLRGGP
jgi:hypothetical protein